MSEDGIKVEVIRSYLLSAAEEMRRTLIRTAFSPAIYEILDFGISIYDGNLDLIASAPGLALFLGANDHAIRRGVAYVGVERLSPGDIVLMNYPYWNAAHAADVTMYAPIFASDDPKPIGFVCIRAHWGDLGAKDPGYVIDSTDMHQEGLIFPGTRVHKGGKPDHEVFELIRFNSRRADSVIGDMEAQIAAIRTGERRILEIYGKFGRASFTSAIKQILDHGESLTRRALASLPHGTFTAEDVIDDDSISDAPVPIRVSITLDEQGMTCDFSGSSPAVRGPINIPLGLTETICKFVLKSLTTPTLPANAGQYRAVKVIAPEKSIFCAVYPSATYTQWGASVAVELLYKALSQAIPERLAACSGGDIFGFMMVGSYPDGRRFGVGTDDPVGWGATLDHDGTNCVNHISAASVRNTPVEVLEMKCAVLCEHMEMRADSGGAGRFRGGLGQSRRMRFTSAGDFLTITKRSKSPPWPLDNGCAAEPNVAIYFPGTDKERRAGTYRTSVLADEVVICQTAGGAGYGHPYTRDADRVLQDVLDGYVSRDVARRLYGVVIAGEEVDRGATDALRRQP